jgi:hypothetical protein
MIPHTQKDRYERSCRVRGVTWSRNLNAWVASMKRRHLLLREIFNVFEYGEDIAFALAIIRRKRMENFWRSSGSRTVPVSRSVCSSKPPSPIENMVHPVPSSNDENEEGLFFDHCSRSWVVRWFSRGQVKRKRFSASGPESFMKAFEFNDRIRRESPPH